MTLYDDVWRFMILCRWFMMIYDYLWWSMMFSLKWWSSIWFSIATSNYHIWYTFNLRYHHPPPAPAWSRCIRSSCSKKSSSTCPSYDRRPAGHGSSRSIGGEGPVTSSDVDQWSLMGYLGDYWFFWIHLVYKYWLVVYLPLWKIWVRQWEGLSHILKWKITHVWNHQPDIPWSWDSCSLLTCHVLILGSCGYWSRDKYWQLLIFTRINEHQWWWCW